MFFFSMKVVICNIQNIFSIIDENKPDMVWPYTAEISASAVSQDTSLMIIGFVDGNIVMWDRYLGKSVI